MFKSIIRKYKNKKKIGLALGGGGARGFAHIGFLKVFDELSIKPSMISGTSIGAMIGALYCNGINASEIESILSDLNLFKWSKLLDISFLFGKGLIKGDKIINLFKNKLTVENIEDLEIPLKVVATDYWNRKEIVFDSGNIIDAIRASISIPGLFEPVEKENYILTDGGAVNPLPYDLLLEHCGFIIAIDVSGKKVPINEKNFNPGILNGLLSTFSIMEESIIKNKLKQKMPDIYIKPDLLNFELLDFHKLKEIIKSVEVDIQNFKDILQKNLKEKKIERYILSNKN